MTALLTTGSTNALSASARISSNARRERRKIWNIHDVSHCSIIGTCLSVSELRRLARRAGVKNGDRYTDFEMHGWFVDQMSQEGALARLTQKYLDSKYEGPIRKAASLADERSFLAHWEQALDNGFVAGAYWAMLTHPVLPAAVESRIFGEVHMMSHISGASHRWEARVVSELRREKAEVARRLSRLLAQRGEELDEARAEILKSKGAACEIQKLSREVDRLKLALDKDPQQQRIDALERENKRLHAESAALAEQKGRLASEYDRVLRRLERLQKAHYGEAAPIDQPLDAGPDAEASAKAADLPRDLCGRSLLYVGGRPRTICRLKDWVAGLNGRLFHHDGGMEDSAAILGQLVRRVDAVFFPVDCVSHGAVDIVKTVCDSHGVPYAPLPTASAAAFARAIRTIVREPELHRVSTARQ